MVGQDEFGNHLAGIHHAQGAGTHHHPLRTAGGAGGGEVAPSFHFNHTDAARCGVVLDAGTLQVDVTKGRDVDTYFAGGFQDGSAFGHGDVVPVYLQGNLFLFHGNGGLADRYGFELAACHAHAALDALVRIDDVGLAHISHNGVCRTMLEAEVTADAQLRIDGVGEQ